MIAKIIVGGGNMIKKVKTGIPGMDEILHGGIPERNIVLISGGPVPERRSSLSSSYGTDFRWGNPASMLHSRNTPFR